jgi:hypothetical protein
MWLKVRKRWIRIALLVILMIVLAAGGGIVFIFRPYSFGNPPRIPQGWGWRYAPKFKGYPAIAKQLDVQVPPCNPNLARTASSNMHVDTYASDAHIKGGPLGRNPRIQTYAHGRFGGECACVTFDSKGNIVAVCATFKEFSLLLMCPETLEPMARLNLPPRASNKSLNLRKIMTDTSGGAYFFLDAKDRAVLVDAKQDLTVVGQRWSGGIPRFEIEEKYALKKTLVDNTGAKDVVTSVLPDWQGRYWFVSRDGLVGVLEPDTGGIAILRLEGEEIQNSFAIDENCTYIVSDKALYGIGTEPQSNRPMIFWREEYEVASRNKVGTITRGSGSTPTLLGDRYVAITDNAEPRMHVLVYDRRVGIDRERLVGKVAVFEGGKSATENTLIGIGNSLIVENNYGYDLFINMMFGRTGAGGICRIDFSEEEGCKIRWNNTIISQTTVPKLSLETGLVYVYTKDPSVGRGIDAYYLSALDFETGETKFEVLVGTGVSFDNNWAPITIGSDRSAYVGVLRGLVKVFDGE